MVILFVKVFEMALFECEVCQKTFANARSRNRHRKGHNVGYTCGKCDKSFTRADLLRRHEKIHDKVVEQNVLDTCNLEKVIVTKHNGNTSKPDIVGDVIYEIDGMELKCCATAFKGYLQTYYIKPTKKYGDLMMFLNDARVLLRKLTDERRGVKLWVCVKVGLLKFDGEEVIVHVSTQQMVVLPGTDVDMVLDTAISDLVIKFEEKHAQGSGWMLQTVLSADVHLSKYMPLRCD